LKDGTFYFSESEGRGKVFSGKKSILSLDKKRRKRKGIG